LKYIVIGGSGFLGRYVTAELLDKGEKVVVCDLVPPPEQRAAAGQLSYVHADVRRPETLQELRMNHNDMVIHLAANQYHTAVPRKNREAYFSYTNAQGTRNVLERMAACGASRMVYFSSDMVYGKPVRLPVDEDHPKAPFGPYGHSKLASEGICEAFREQGFHITIFRPRMIIGPGRLGVLKKLFKLITNHLPVPLIGGGSNHYQMISVQDCTSAVLHAIEKGIPNQAYNLGSKQPPTVRELLQSLITCAQSRSILVSTHGGAVKSVLSGLSVVGIELLYKEQYMIADENYLVDIARAEHDLDWTPMYTDSDMINEAFLHYLSMSREYDDVSATNKEIG
jgi:nucleoside-diphosphate-sugar epimerase